MHFKETRKQDRTLLWLHNALEVGLRAACLGLCYWNCGMLWKNIKYTGACEPEGSKYHYRVFAQSALVDRSVSHHFSAQHIGKHLSRPSLCSQRGEASRTKKGKKKRDKAYLDS